MAHRGHFRIMFRPELKMHLSKEQSAIADEPFAMLRGAIARCQEEGTIAAGDPRTLVLLAWSAVHGASVLWIDGPLSSKGLVDDAEALARTIADTLAGLLKRDRRNES
jgi:hypothetical protein